MHKITAMVCVSIFMLFQMTQTNQQTQMQMQKSPEQQRYEEQRRQIYDSLWESSKFVLGDWKTQGATESAGFAAQQSLDGKVLVITNSEPLIMPAGFGKKPANYKSLMYIYVDELTPRATIFDNQGQVITFDVQTGPGKFALVSPSAPTTRIEFENPKEGIVSVGPKPEGGVRAVKVPARQGGGSL